MSAHPRDGFGQQLESLYAISIEIAKLHEVPKVLDLALGYCLDLTGSEFGFFGLLNQAGDMMDVAAIRGFEPPDPTFYDRFRLIPVRQNLLGIVIREGSGRISNDALNDHQRGGQPRGHPTVRTFLGVPLKVGDGVIGMIGVANHPQGYTRDDERLLSTFANQAAVAIENARLYESQREMIERMRVLDRERSESERERVLRDERARIATHLHDEIEQAIFVVGLRIKSELERPDLLEETRRRLDEVRQLLARITAALKEIVFTTSESVLAQQDLPTAVRRLVEDLGRRLGLETHLIVDGRPVSAGPEADAVLFQVAQRAVLNVVRHSHAHAALISLHYTDEQVQLVVQDDGVGAAPEVLDQLTTEKSNGFGLISARRQVAALGGSFDVSNGEEGGLVVRARVPIRHR